MSPGSFRRERPQTHSHTARTRSRPGLRPGQGTVRFGRICLKYYDQRQQMATKSEIKPAGPLTRACRGLVCLVIGDQTQHRAEEPKPCARTARPQTSNTQLPRCPLYLVGPRGVLSCLLLLRPHPDSLFVLQRARGLGQGADSLKAWSCGPQCRHPRFPLSAPPPDVCLKLLKITPAS